ncbi:hypothetical protein LB521_27595 [Mesorhizobium sp. BR-1-1-8]|uniref:hypothetical protein n=1 Tax=unclassified Mesorhizobium TaxID=325217 RepID=UPI001CC91B94|nr:MULTISPECIES: hypothetical protein [unclassified Mesorhizobium]MBZ9973542.1 hypothetical protein [Mesorhizobium sp. BR1-1-12]MBZ9984901.1 hypothetical protein [Mesorhizobium sp. BR-1-1-8]
MSEIPKDIEKAADAAFYKAWDHGHSGAVARAILAERKRCADIATANLRNVSQMLSSPPKSGAAWDIRNAINSGEQP